MNTDNFFSVERLIEFGVGMGVAQQMVRSMNAALQDAYLPSAQATQLTGLQPPVLPPTFFVVLDGRQAGPFNEAEISRLIADRRITKATYIWRPGMLQWGYAEDVPEILRIIALAPPPPPPPVPSLQTTESNPVPPINNSPSHEN